MALDRARIAVDAWRMTEVKLACEAVWKLFGPQPERFLAAHDQRPTPADLAAAGLICAVRDASFEVREGEIFVIMGLSGSGKSTLVRCLSRLIEPTAGRVLFEGRNLLEDRIAISGDQVAGQGGSRRTRRWRRRVRNVRPGPPGRLIERGWRSMLGSVDR